MTPPAMSKFSAPFPQAHFSCIHPVHSETKSYTITFVLSYILSLRCFVGVEKQKVLKVIAACIPPNFCLRVIVLSQIRTQIFEICLLSGQVWGCSVTVVTQSTACRAGLGFLIGSLNYLVTSISRLVLRTTQPSVNQLPKVK